MQTKAYFYLNSEVPLTQSTMYSTIIEDSVISTFSNIVTVLRIFLCLFVTNVADERSFSKLKYIKKYLRNSLTDAKLNSLALMSIEHKLLDAIDIDDIIDKFIELKCRRKLYPKSK